MPTYSYRCTGCGWSEDLVLSIKSSPSARKCPKCGKNRYERQFVPGVQFNAGTRLEYPHVNRQLPFDPKTRRPTVVQSPRHERYLADKAGMLINQGMSSDHDPKG